MVLGHRHGQRRALVLPVGDQLVRAPSGSITAPDRMCAPTSLPFSRMQTRQLAARFARPAASGGSRRSSPAGPGADDHHVILHGFALAHPLPFVRRAGNAFRPYMPCQFLDRAVNGGEERAVGGEVESIGIAEARSALAWWLEAGVDVAVQEEPRDWLKPRRPRSQRPPSRAPPPNVVEPSHETLAELQRLAGEQRRSCRSPRPRRKRDPAARARRCRRSCCSAMRPRSRMRGRPADRRRSLGAGASDARRDRHRRRRRPTAPRCPASMRPARG